MLSFCFDLNSDIINLIQILHLKKEEIEFKPFNNLGYKDCSIILANYIDIFELLAVRKMKNRKYRIQRSINSSP